MKLDVLCLGILYERKYTGYDIHKLLNTTLSHIRQASFGALYPALGRLEVKEFLTTERTPLAATGDSLGKRVYTITETGKEYFLKELEKISATETLNSDFLSAMYFADKLAQDDVSLLIDERLSILQNFQKTLLKQPLSELSHGQRFTIRYSLSVTAAAISFLKGEGRAIQTVLSKDR